MIETKNTDTLKFPHQETGCFLYCLHLADNALILAQRNSEWCAHGPVLEQDIAITNISLDLLGQARNFYQHAANLYNNYSANEKESIHEWLPRQWFNYHRELNEDDLAFLREENQYLNLSMCELPKGDWAQTILRQFFFSAYQQLLYSELEKSDDQQLTAIAEKSLKEVNYHLRWSSEWVIRLGDGTEESQGRIKNAVSELWNYTNEIFNTANYELIDISVLKSTWQEKIDSVFDEATLPSPLSGKAGELIVRYSGKHGRHTEYLGYLLAEMQYLQRTYPDAKW